jgi:hypothetical protein
MYEQELTGRSRYRTDNKNKIILQVEIKEIFMGSGGE